MGAFFRDAGLRRVSEQEVTSELECDTPDEYWSFMTEVAAPVVAGLAKADDAVRKRIKSVVLDLARQSSPSGKPRFLSTATIICGEK